jgi:hypothetical protein
MGRALIFLTFLLCPGFASGQSLPIDPSILKEIEDSGFVKRLYGN